MEKTEKTAGKEAVWTGEKLGVWNTIGEAMLFMKEHYKILFLIALAGAALPARQWPRL